MDTTTQPLIFKPRTRRIPLDFLGEGWEEAYIETRYMLWSDSRAWREQLKQELDEDKATQVMIDTIAGVFVSGKAVAASGELVHFTPADIAAFDVDAMNQIYRSILGIEDPKA